ncbi:hypothetical protein H8N03_09115 [Ramlibacter sp. USB13]|uniref:NnrS family protein n=1 Tax=Ramlibacter cellulosilyticus TaxID=2764187 RepID=A0A923SAT0_9BURK|nr:hypothetical protein [Ramlibacter cellulosilyticus]
MNARRLVGALLLACVAASLLAGITGGLLRVGIAATDAPWLGRAALAHAALMMCGFMGTVIGIERAVAAKRRLAWAPPLLSGAAGLLLLRGVDTAAGILLVAAGIAFIAVNVLLLRRQRAPHTMLLLASACAWAVGNLLFAAGAASTAVLPWWFAFLVITVAAERLEMTRLMRRRPAAQPALAVILALVLLGAGASAFTPAAGGALFGSAIFALALWLFTFDIARRTVRAQGLPRYMAVCLLGGYAWLAAGGVAWAATALGWPARDLALHALGLGFLVSMILGHAPVILPAIARVKLLFGNFFYLPLAALHASLLLRLGAGFLDFGARRTGALFNALSIALFALTVLGAAFAWRRRHGGRPSGSPP